MPVPLDFLKDPWADTGDRVQFPYNPDTVTELMSWLKGFTAKYQILPEEGGVYIERREFNQILYLLTKQVIDAFNITASDEQLNAETAARIEAINKETAARIEAINREKADRIEAINKEKADRIEKDSNLQQQLNTKFMRLANIGINLNFGVTYTAQYSGVMIISIEWGRPGEYIKPGCEFMNAELRCSNGVNPQFVFATPYAWESSGTALSGTRGNVTLVAVVESGDTYELHGETKFGTNGASQMLVTSAKMLY